MDDLRPDHKEFVKEYLDNGGNATQAVKTVYDEESYSYAGVKGHRMLKNDKIREAIENAAEGAFSRIVELSKIAQNETVKLNANKDIVDRAGYKPTDKTDLTSGGNPIQVIIPASVAETFNINGTHEETGGSNTKQSEI